MSAERTLESAERREDSTINSSIFLPTGGEWTNETLESWKIRPNVDSKPLTAERIMQVTGIERRYRAGEFETPQYIAEQVMVSLLKENRSIDALLVSNSNPSGVNISEYLSNKYGIGGTFHEDIHFACSGFAEELAILGENPDPFIGKRVALIAAENYQDTLEPLEKNANIQDKSLAAVIFSAGGAGIEFVYGKGLTVIGSKKLEKMPFGVSQALKMVIDLSKMVEPYHALDIPRSNSGYFEQDGPKVYEAVRNNIPRLIVDSIYESGLPPSNIKMIIPHQPSIKVLDALVDQTGKMLKERGQEPIEFFYDIKDGNFSSASALKAMIKAMDQGLISRGDNIVIAQFGAGFYGRSVVVRLG